MTSVDGLETTKAAFATFTFEDKKGEKRQRAAAEAGPLFYALDGSILGSTLSLFSISGVKVYLEASNGDDLN